MRSRITDGSGKRRGIIFETRTERHIQNIDIVFDRPINTSDDICDLTFSVCIQNTDGNQFHGKRTRFARYTFAVQGLCRDQPCYHRSVRIRALLRIDTRIDRKIFYGIVTGHHTADQILMRTVDTRIHNGNANGMQSILAKIIRKHGKRLPKGKILLTQIEIILRGIASASVTIGKRRCFHGVVIGNGNDLFHGIIEKRIAVCAIHEKHISAERLTAINKLKARHRRYVFKFQNQPVVRTDRMIELGKHIGRKHTEAKRHTKNQAYESVTFLHKLTSQIKNNMKKYILLYLYILYI